jgi:hypothetical protein
VSKTRNRFAARQTPVTCNDRVSKPRREAPEISFHSSVHSRMDEARRRQRRTTLRKYSRQKRDVRVTTGNLDPELDFVCPFCNGVYSLFHGRHKLHLKNCKIRIAKAAKIPRKLSLPPPPPFEIEVFPVHVAGECTIGRCSSTRKSTARERFSTGVCNPPEYWVCCLHLFTQGFKKGYKDPLS